MTTDAGADARCYMCGSHPAGHVDGHGRSTCAVCVEKYIVSQCEGCGVWMTRHKDHNEGPCSTCVARARWQMLPAEIREQVDEAVRRDERFLAVKTLVIDARPELKIMVGAAQGIVSLRYSELQGEIVFKPERGPDLPDLIANVEAFEDAPVAFEAIWDGDTQGWFLLLEAIIERPGHQHARYSAKPLSYYRKRAGDIRIFNGQVPPWPESAEAIADGEALAAHFGVPFHFASPDAPDDAAPRWWDGRS